MGYFFLTQSFLVSAAGWEQHWQVRERQMEKCGFVESGDRICTCVCVLHTCRGFIAAMLQVSCAACGPSTGQRGVSHFGFEHVLGCQMKVM